MQATTSEDMDGVMRQGFGRSIGTDRSDRRELGLRDFRGLAEDLSARRLEHAHRSSRLVLKAQGRLEENDRGDSADLGGSDRLLPGVRH